MTNLSNIVEILAQQALGGQQQSGQGGLGGILGSVLGQVAGGQQQSQGGLGGILGSVLGGLGGGQIIVFLIFLPCRSGIIRIPQRRGTCLYCIIYMHESQ